MPLLPVGGPSHAANGVVLERQGIRCWIALRDIIHGDEWGAAIIGGINGSRMMVLIFSGHANASGQVHREVERAISRGIAVLPVRVEDVRPEGAMEFALGNRHWLDAFTPPFERQLEELARSVKSLLGQPAGPVVGGPTVDPGRGPTPGPHREPRRPVRLAAVLAVSLAASAAVGWVVMSRGKAAPTVADPAGPIPVPAPRSDEDWIQGRWQGVDLAIPPGVQAKKKGFDPALEAARTFWTFRGKELTIGIREGGADEVRLRGQFSLSRGVERKLFDFATRRPDGQEVAFAGIYEFDGEFLRVCYGIRLDLANEPADSKRPDSFLVTGGGFRRSYVKLKRVGD